MYALRTVVRNNEWATSTTLFESGLEVNPGNHKFWLFIAQGKSFQADQPGVSKQEQQTLLGDAASHFEMAVKLDGPAPGGLGFDSIQPSHRRGFGRVLQALGRAEEAAVQFKLAGGE
jgi:hypothetical protein